MDSPKIHTAKKVFFPSSLWSRTLIKYWTQFGKFFALSSNSLFGCHGLSQKKYIYMKRNNLFTDSLSTGSTWFIHLVAVAYIRLSV